MKNQTYSLKNTARLAGLLYLIWIISALYSLFYVPSQINMKEDPAVVAQNILSNELLFRTSIVMDLINGTIWIFMILIFFQLFKSINRNQAILMFAFVIVQIPVAIVLDIFNITSLMILKGEVLKTLELNQRQDIATFFLKISDYGVMALILYWGLWLLPLGILVYRSQFIPRFLGAWLLINGIAYLVMCIMGLLQPQYKNIIFKITIPAMVGEFAFMLWLLIKGVKTTKSIDTP